MADETQMINLTPYQSFVFVQIFKVQNLSFFDGAIRLIGNDLEIADSG